MRKVLAYVREVLASEREVLGFGAGGGYACFLPWLKCERSVGEKTPSCDEERRACARARATI